MLIAVKATFTSGNVDVSSVISVVPKINTTAIKIISDLILIDTYIPPEISAKEFEVFFETLTTLSII